MYCFIRVSVLLVYAMQVSASTSAEYLIAVGCKFYGMVSYWCGCTSITLLCAVTIERTITITNPIWSMANKDVLPKYIHLMMAFCWVWGFVWALTPFTGKVFSVF